MNLNERGAGRSCPHSPSLHHHGAAEMVFQLRVHDPTGVEKIIDLCDNEEQMKKMTVLQLKLIIKKTLMITGDNLQLVFGGQDLEDGSLLVSHNIKHMSAIQTAVQLPGGI
ncbi:uncharacterized protein AB9X84_016016 [Acanthopagrus schlegelii]